MEIELIKAPTDADWMLVKRTALETVGKSAKTAPTIEWKKAILEARHSPIRLLQFVFELRDIPYWLSVHLARHVHAMPFVRSQRNDRQSDYDRNAARQDAPVNMIWAMNAEELCVIANKRLCNLAAKETRDVVKMMCQLVIINHPEFADVLVPACEFNGKCHEMRPCGKIAELQKQMPNTPLTNRAGLDYMTDEQLAHWLVERVTDSLWCKPDAPVDPETKRCQIWDCEKCALEWLRQEAGQCTK